LGSSLLRHHGGPRADRGILARNQSRDKGKNSRHRGSYDQAANMGSPIDIG
jgi:hypothetical protein